MLIIKSGKKHLTDGMELPNPDKLEHSREGNLQILGHLRGWHDQTSRDERIVKKESS